MKTFEKFCYYVPLLSLAYFALNWFLENQELNKSLKKIKARDELPIHVKIIEPNATGICLRGFLGDIWWLENSPQDETDFVYANSDNFRRYIVGGVARLKIPPNAVAYILRGDIPEDEFTVEYYFDRPKVNSNVVSENNSY